MTCEEIRSRISLLLENELSPLNQKKVIEHLESCTDCAALRDKVGKLIADLKGLKQMETSSDFDAALRRKIESTGDESFAGRALLKLMPSGKRAKVTLLAAAAVVLLLIGAFLVPYFLGDSTGVTTPYTSIGAVADEEGSENLSEDQEKESENELGEDEGIPAD